MSTRSGRSYRKETRETMAQESAMTSIQNAMRQLLDDRKQCEIEIAEERRHQREESERRMEEMSEQMALLQRMVAEWGAPTIRDPSEGRPALKLTRLGERDDIEAFLVTFERTMEAYEVDTARWSFMLAPQLTGKAQQAYAAMAADAARVYENLKAAILRRYNINEDTYRQRFRTAKLKAGETPGSWPFVCATSPTAGRRLALTAPTRNGHSGHIRQGTTDQYHARRRAPMGAEAQTQDQRGGGTVGRGLHPGWTAAYPDHDQSGASR